MKILRIILFKFHSVVVSWSLLFLLTSCSSYPSKVNEAKVNIKKRQFSEASEMLKKLSDQISNDQLAYLLDYAMALQLEGRYKESSAIFTKADQLAELQDYHSVSKVTASILVSADMVQYKGDSYEKIFMNIFSAINYLLINNYDEALVEIRRLNEKINKFRLDGRETYEQNPFAHYLSGVIWEAQKKYDDAYISYESAYNLDGRNPLLPMDLIRSAELAHRSEAAKKWKAQFSNHPSLKNGNPWWKDKSMGELIVVFQQGWGPQKTYSPSDYRIPVLRPIYSATQWANIFVVGNESASSEPIATLKVYDVEEVAIQTLKDDYAWIFTRAVISDVSKYVIAKKVDENNSGLGALTYLALSVADRADLRQWSTLPQTIQFARIPLKSGSYKVKIQGVNSGGGDSNESLENITIDIRPGKKSFINWRSLN